jgi:Mg2+/Co2+ transporter CorB
MSSEVFIWLGILFCISQSATFSGLNLAVFSLSRLHLDIEQSSGNEKAAKVIALRKNSNYTLTTILWGNVGINVLLALLSNSVLTGLIAFIFSTFVITIFGEIVPQAYFSRHALKTASFFYPILKFYQFILYPVARPSAYLLDLWLGKEGIKYYRERELKEVIRHHISASGTEVDKTEGIGALNFLNIDDIPAINEGVSVHQDSIISLESENGLVKFPIFTNDIKDPFIKLIQSSGEHWVIFIDRTNEPILVMDADGFLRHALLSFENTNPQNFCHKPLVIHDAETTIGEAMAMLKFDSNIKHDDIIKHDVILIWTEEKRIITGRDLLGSLLRGIAI